MREKLKRLLCAGLVVAMTIGMFAAPVYAAPTEADTGTQPAMDVWVQNSADRAFASSQMPETAQKFISLYAARNEYEAAQILVRSEAELYDLSLAASDLRGEDGTISSSNIVMYSEYSAPASASGDVEPTPDGSNLYTDALLPVAPMDLEAHVTQPYWVRVYVPKGTEPGVYSGSVTVTANEGTFVVPVSVNVYDVTIPDTDESAFKMNNWFASVDSGFAWLQNSVLNQYNVELFDENWWKVMESFARDFAIHRNNVIYLDAQALVRQDSTMLTEAEAAERQQYVTGTDGKMAAGKYLFDWNKFDRMVDLFVNAGAMQYLYLPGTALVVSGNNINIRVLEEQNGAMTSVEKPVFLDPDTGVENPEARAWVNVFFTALRAHIQEKYPQFLDKVYTSAVDEPSTEIQNKGSNWYYSAIREVYPEALSIEAHVRYTPGMTESTALCPVLDVYEGYQHFYQAEKEAGKELWYYTAISPMGDYLNRFIPFHLIKTRLIPWYAFKVGATGYLHWGYTFWGKKDTFDSLQSGDEWLVRPDAEHYDVFTSVRSEAQLDGLEDYELLTLLAGQNQDAANRIVNTVMESATSYTKDGAAAMNAHKALLDALAGREEEPIAMSLFRDDFQNGFDYAWNRYDVAGTSWSVDAGRYNYHGAATSELGMTTLRNQTIKNGKISVTLQLGEGSGWAGITFRKGDPGHNSFVSGYTLAVLKNGTMLVFRTPNWRTIAEGVPVTFDSDGKIRLNISMNGSKFVVSQGVEETILCTFEDDAIAEGYISLVGTSIDAAFSDFRQYTYDGVEEARVSAEVVKDQSYMREFEDTLADWRIEGDVTVDSGAMLLRGDAKAGLEGRVFTETGINVTLNLDGEQTAGSQEDYWAGIVLGKETVYGDVAKYGGCLVKISKSGTVQLASKDGVVKSASLDAALSGDTAVTVNRGADAIQVKVNGTAVLTADVTGYAEGFVSLCSGGGTVKVTSFTVARNTMDDSMELLDDFSGDLSKWTKVMEPSRIQISDGTLQMKGVVEKRDEDAGITGAGVDPDALYKVRKFENVRIGFDLKLDDVAFSGNWAGAYFHSSGTKGFWTSGGYLLFLTSTKNLVVFKGGENVNIASAMIEEDPMTKAVHLEMEIVDGVLKVFVNYGKEPVITVEDTTYTSGYFGLIADWTDATYDNVTYQDLGPCSIGEPEVPVVWNEAFSDDFENVKSEWALVDASAGRIAYEDGKVQLNGIHPNNPVTYALRGNAYTSVEIAAEMSIPSKDEGWAGFGVGRSSWNGSVWADGYYLLGMYNSVTGKAEMKIYNPTYGFIAEADLDYDGSSLVKFRMEVLGKNISVYRGEETTPFMQAYASDYEGGFVALCNYAAKNLYDNFSVQHLEDPLVWDEPYADDFSADTGNWINVSDAMGSFTIADGTLTAAGSNGAHPEQVALKNRAYRNMDLSVDLTMPDSTVGWSSVSFGRANWNDTIWAGGYFVTVSHNASTGLADLVLWKANADASGGIAAMGQASTADAVSGVLTLRIVVNDGEISVYTGSGSTPLITAKAEDYAGGYLTLCSYMSQNSFDNFRIGKPSPVGKTVWDEPYADAFDEDTNNWINVNDTMGSFTIADGTLTAVGTVGSDPEQVALKNRAYHDMDLSVDLTMPDSKVGWSSVAFGRENWNARIWDGGYFVTVAHNADTGLVDLVLWKANADAYGNIVLQGQASVAGAAGDALTLRIVVKDGEISVYAGSGSAPVIVAQAEDYAGGYLALCSYTSQNSFDNFNVAQPANEVLPESITISADNMTLEEGATGQLTAEIRPEDATDKTLTWTSGDTTVAAVDETGKVTAVAAGTATITVATANGKTAECVVTVVHKLVHVDAVTATCMETGTVEHWHCECCGKNYADEAAAEELETVTAPIDPGNHVHTETQGYQAPTVSKPGYSGDTVCTDCGRTVEKGQTLPATGTGHVPGSGTAGRDENKNENPFCDVNQGDYFYDAVIWAAKNGITSGTDSTHFSPNAATTRGQMVTFLWRAAGSPEPKSTSCDFTDVDPDSYYYKAVLWAAEAGITRGTSDTTFSPDANVTRGQMVTFLARMAGVKDDAAGFSHSFTDVKDTDFFSNAAAWAYTSGITKGTSDTTFSPADNCLRGQMVTFLYRFFVK